MQTDCPTQVEKDRQMKGRNGWMREMIVPKVTRLEEEKKLPRTRDPEFATPKSQEWTDIQGQRTTAKKEKREKQRRQLNKSRTARKQSHTRWSQKTQSRSSRSYWTHWVIVDGNIVDRLTISCCSCICAIFLVYFWSTCFSSPTTPSQRSLKAFLSLMSWSTNNMWEKFTHIHHQLLLGCILCVFTHLINERQVSLDGGFILFLLELKVPAQLLLCLLHMSHRQLPLLGLDGQERR